MTGPNISGLSLRTFRAGQAYDMVVFDRLSAEEQSLLGELRADPDFYGVLRPRPGSGRTIKAVTNGTALLWFTLQSPGRLPFFLFRNDSNELLGTIPELLLDGVLEVENEGRFLSGPEAAALLAEGRPTESSGSQGRLALLSEAALMYGESLLLDDPGPLAGRLYGFGRLPVTPRWRRLLADREAVLRFLGAGAGTGLRRFLNSDWQEETGKLSGWLVWFNRSRGKSAFGEANYKLYVSPATAALPQVFAAVLEVTAGHGGHFKMGGDAAGLLRPDKMVLYFRDQELLLKVASALAEKLKDVEPHGVPFSAEIARNGLLSWGMDPPQTERLMSWQEPESWRLWVVRRLAAAMVAAQANSLAGMPPGKFALERLRHEGVDVAGWTPSISLWQRR